MRNYSGVLRGEVIALGVCPLKDILRCISEGYRGARGSGDKLQWVSGVSPLKYSQINTQLFHFIQPSLYSQWGLTASMQTELDLSLRLRCATDPILTLEDNVCVCVCLCPSVVWTSETDTGLYLADSPQLSNSETLWSGRLFWQSWHLSLSGWECLVCEWPGAGGDTLNYLHRVSVGSHGWVCTSGSSHHAFWEGLRVHVQMFTLPTPAPALSV